MRNRNWEDIKKIEDFSTKHINTFSISLLTFMTSLSQKRKLKLNSNVVRYCKIAKKETKTL